MSVQGSVFRVLRLRVRLPACPVIVVFLAVVPARAQEPKEFFQAFATATAQYEQGQVREAAASLQAVSQKLKTFPWRQVAVLKAAELHESFDRATATKNYEELTGQLKDRTSDKMSQLIYALANRGLQRMETLEVEAALRKYYLDKVEYPASLDQLAQAGYIAAEKIRDASGKPYSYSTGEEKLLPQIPRQTYTLERIESPAFGWKGAKIVGMSPKAALVQWPNAASRSLRAGDTVEGMEVLSVLDNGVVLGNDARLVVLSYK